MKTHKNRYFRQISDIKEKLEDGISEYVSFFFFFGCKSRWSLFGSRSLQQLQLSSNLVEASYMNVV